ncbi:MAG: hypothetical protein AAGC68_16555 [Verrucomicrobiota bacterium]
MSHFRRSLFRFLLLAAVGLSGVQCETMTSGVGSGGTVTVQGTMFYPDELGKTFIVPAGAQVVGAGGKNCHFLIHAGGSLTAHSGDGNTYRVKAGGHFRGFAHPATNCTVSVEPGAIVETEQGGPGTVFKNL